MILAHIVLSLNLFKVVAGDVCQLPEDNRQDCNIKNKDDCMGAGCCWQPVNPNPKNLPWCFKASGCQSGSRNDCKRNNQKDCLGAGCCWQPVALSSQNVSSDGTPWCFFSSAGPSPSPGPMSCSLAAQPQVPFSTQEIEQVRQYFEANLDIEGTGMVVASPSRSNPDYYYSWMRDGALSMNALQLTASKFADIQQKMEKWLAWVEKSQSESDPNPNSILEEPKFNIPDGSAYTGGWCRPQNDGPGLRAITLMGLAANNPDIKQRVWNVVRVDLDFVTGNWGSNTCDLWEEVRSSDFFWNRFTMRKALLQGAKFANSMGDSSRASNYGSVAKTIEHALSDHVQSDGFVCESGNRCQDTSVIEAFNVGYMDDGVYAPLNKEVVATLNGLSKLFCTNYQVNKNAASGVLFGRYDGDSYYGGNPWVLLSASAATLFYRQAEALAKGQLLRGSHSALDQEAAAMLQELVGGEVTASSLLGAGDAILLLMKKYLTNGMHMNEQIDRNSGALKSARDLTWSYANVLKAMKARGVAAKASLSASVLAV